MPMRTGVEDPGSSGRKSPVTSSFEAEHRSVRSQAVPGAEFNSCLSLTAPERQEKEKGPALAPAPAHGVTRRWRQSPCGFQKPGFFKKPGFLNSICPTTRL